MTRMLRPMRMRVVALPLLLVLAACSGSNEVASLATSEPAAPVDLASESGSRSPSPPASPLPGVLVERTCGGGGGGGGCNAGFALNGKDYFLSCEPVSPGSVAEEVMGAGLLYGQQVTVRRIEVGTNAGQVAVGPTSGGCGPEAVAPGYYVVAAPVGSS
jgi:hypothetical protein